MKAMPKINVQNLLLSIFSTLFIIGGAFLIYYFSRGYRFDIAQRGILKTGVINVQSEPSSATLYINGEEIGKTPRSRTLPAGVQNISLWKEGYREWKKDITIIEERTTPIFPFLILQEITGSKTWEFEGEIEKFYMNETKDIITVAEKIEDSKYKIWTYSINRPLWNFNPNPIQNLTLETSNFDLFISPNGQTAILEVIEEEEKSHYIVDLQKNSTDISNLQTINTENLETYSLKWANDNKHIIMESDQDILSIDIYRNARYLLLKKQDGQKQIWDTDEEGFFYSLESENNEDDSTYIYSLKQYRLDSTNPRYTIEKAYFNKNTEYLKHYRENGEDYPEFTSSPESTQAMGQIIYFRVSQKAQGVYIQTDTSAYWYDIPEKKYRMVSPYPATLIEFSTDFKKLIFLNGEYYYVFTFEKEDADHTAKIGSKRVDSLQKDSVTNISWLSNSEYLSFSRDNSVHISDKDGENDQEIINSENILLYAVKSSRDILVTLEKNQMNNTVSIKNYRIN